MKTSTILLVLLPCCMTFIEAFPQPEREPLEHAELVGNGAKGGVKGGNRLNTTAFLPPPGFGEPKISNMRNLTGSSLTFANGTMKKDFSKGVCYEEVKTVTLVKDPHNVPPGNGSTTEYSKVRKCCPGYERNIHNFKLCEPVCEHECINAKCIAPNVCACHPDHVINLDGFCVPTCPISCLNGHCDSNKCICIPGYTLDPNNHFCLPKCSGGCGHGNCTAPEVCTCDSGYGANQHGQCVPKCDSGCFNGDCTAPNVCVCEHGYEKDHATGKCSPICAQGCHQGECIAPGVCSCGAGYRMDESNNQCVAHCDRPCLNGDCTGPNQCTCRKGYINDVNDSFKCVGHCPDGCPNGVCSGPNLCLCLPGFTKEKGVKGRRGGCVSRQRRSIPAFIQNLF